MNEQRAPIPKQLREHTCKRLGLYYLRECPECVAELPKPQQPRSAAGRVVLVASRYS
jgi:hypothetical protein